MKGHAMSASDSPPPVDAGELLASDHRHIDELFTKLEAPDGGGSVRASLIRQVVHDLSVHSGIEEVVLYPAARHELPDGDAVADEALHDGREIKKLLVRLERLGGNDPEVERILTKLIPTVRAHVAFEEGPDGMIERLRRAVGDYRLTEMGRSMAKARRTVPTHPHPHAPDTPPANTIAGPAARVIDDLRDRYNDD
jgi:hypothetical protein